MDRQRPEQDAVGDRVDGHGRADPERERQDGRDGETRIAPQPPPGEPHVMPQAFEPRFPPHVPHPVLDGLRASKLRTGGPPRVLAGHTAGHLLLDHGLEVLLEFVAEIRFVLLRAEQGPDAAGDACAERHQISLDDALRMRPIAAVCSCHSMVWRSSFARPLAVSA